MKFWKFVLPKARHRKLHLSKGENSGFQTLCGITFDEFPKKARTITQLEGDECEKCAKESQIEWGEWQEGLYGSRSKTGIYTYPLGRAKKS
jgi:hypothetical protein